MTSDEQSGGDFLAEELAKKLTADHGECIAVRTKAGVAAFRIFKKAEYDRFNRLLGDEKTRAQAFEMLVFACVVHPVPDVFRSWVERYPAIVTTCINPLLEFGGTSAEVETKKYGSA
jgi:hypothetical protein